MKSDYYSDDLPGTFVIKNEKSGGKYDRKQTY